MRRHRRLLLVGSLVLVAALVPIVWLAYRDGGQGFATLGGGQPIAADYYKEVDPHALTIGGVTGSGQWTRITNIVETDQQVLISVRVLRGMGTGTSIGYPVEWTINLQSPLNGRTVNDGFQDLARR